MFEGQLQVNNVDVMKCFLFLYYVLSLCTNVLNPTTQALVTPISRVWTNAAYIFYVFIYFFPGVIQPSLVCLMSDVSISDFL